jgi:hypothetical protein
VTVFSKLIYRFKASSLKVPASFFVEIIKLALKYIWKCKVPETILKRIKLEELIPTFKTSHKTVLLKTVWYWPKNRPLDRWYRIEGPEIILYT